MNLASGPGHVRSSPLEGWKLELTRASAHLLSPTGDLYAWGSNSYKTVDPTSAITVAMRDYGTVRKTGTGFVDIKAGNDHVVALDSSGNVYCWGQNSYDQCQPASSTSPWIDWDTPIFTGAAQIHAGREQTMVITASGDMYAWGRNNYSQCNHTNTSAVTDATSLMATNVDMVLGGRFFTHVVKLNGDLHNWGYGGYGSLYPGLTGNRTDDEVVRKSGVIGGRGGYAHSLILDSTNGLYGWGLNTSKQANPNDAGSPAADTTSWWTPSAEVIKIICGKNYHVSGLLTADGNYHAWGSNTNYASDPSTSDSPATDYTTIRISNVYDVSMGQGVTVALTKDGAIHGWGSNTLGIVDPNVVESASRNDIQNVRFNVFDL